MKIPNKQHIPVAQTILLNSLVKQGVAIEPVIDTPLVLAKKEDKQWYFIDSFTDGIPYHYGLLLASKFYAKQILYDAKIPVAKGKVFTEYEEEDAITYAKEIGFPVIIRFDRVQMAVKGFIGIKNKKSFQSAFQTLAAYKENILIEKYHTGKSFRVCITKDGFYNVLQKQSPCIVGDGSKTVEDLLIQENKKRLFEMASYIQPLQYDEIFFQQYSIKKRMVVPKGKKIVFSQSVSAKDGATFVDITDIAHISILHLAKRVIQAFPGIGYISFELLTPPYTKDLQKGKYIVGEIYISPGPHMHFSFIKNKRKKDAKNVFTELLFSLHE